MKEQDTQVDPKKLLARVSELSEDFVKEVKKVKHEYPLVYFALLAGDLMKNKNIGEDEESDGMAILRTYGALTKKWDYTIDREETTFTMSERQRYRDLVKCLFIEEQGYPVGDCFEKHG